MSFKKIEVTLKSPKRVHFLKKYYQHILASLICYNFRNYRFFISQKIAQMFEASKAIASPCIYTYIRMYCIYIYKYTVKRDVIFFFF